MEISLKITFWTNSGGNAPVIDDIEALPVKPREKVYWTIKLLKTKGTALMRTEFLNKIEDSDLFELRIRYQKVWYRILLIIHKGIACLLHMFKKKKNKLPLKELKIAQKRAGLYLNTIQIIIN